MGFPIVETFQKDPDEKLDYEVDWTNRLATGDTISSSDWVVPVGITSSAPTNDSTTTTIWLEGGSANTNYDLINRITTAAGRKHEASIRITVRSTVQVPVAVGESLFPVVGLEDGRIAYGSDDSALQASANLTYVSGSLVLKNSADADLFDALTVSSGSTGTYRRYLKWTDYDDSTTGYLGWNADDAVIIFQNAGGAGTPPDDEYHVLVANRASGSGHTYLSSADAVYVNYDSNLTGSGGLWVWDGTASGTAASPANVYGIVNSNGVQVYQPRDIRAFESTATDYTRILHTTRGYLHSTEEIRIYNAADRVTIGNSSAAERFRFDASASQFYVGANPVVGARATGWGAPTGTATRTTFDTTTATTEGNAERIKALIDDLTTHGLIGA